MYPVSILWLFVDRSQYLQAHMPVDHTLFLTNIDREQEGRPVLSLVTAANWAKERLSRAKIDTSICKVHSIRAAASTQTVQVGIPIQTVKLHAGWPLRTSMFVEVCLKAQEQQEPGRHILETEFGD
jgi:hypothetical protein